MPKTFPVDVSNPAEPNPVVAGADGAGGATGCPNTVLAAVVVVLLAAVMVEVLHTGATVFITGVTAMVPLSVTTGAGGVKRGPGLSELVTWNAAGAT